MTPDNPAAFWDDRFQSPAYAYGTQPNDFLAEVANRIPPGPVLCLAEGEGRNAVFLASRGHDVLAVDFSSVGLTKALALADKAGVSIRVQQADLADFDIQPGAWSAIVSIWAHLSPQTRISLHQRCTRGLADGGAFVLEAYTPAQLTLGTGGPRQLDWLMASSSLRTELAGLHFTIAREIQRDVNEGPCHRGPSAVVQILAFR